VLQKPDRAGVKMTTTDRTTAVLSVRCNLSVGRNVSDLLDDYRPPNPFRTLCWMTYSRQKK
jgi:hypothetical protein